MIQRVDIKSFGSFSEFIWNNQIKRDGSVVDFKKLNILYGRNYSGKTTISRVIRSLETGILPSNYDSPSFSIKTDTGIITPANIGSHGHNVRVFNKDFVDDHLGFLRDDEGNIEPFAILGGDNTKTEKIITEKEKSLGSIESKTGLKHNQAEIESKLQTKQAAANKAESDRTEKLRNKANQEIKQSPQLYGDVSYNIQNIEHDIKSIQLKNLTPLETEEEEILRALLKQDALPPIDPIPSLDLKLSTLHKDATDLLEREIKPTKPIQDLIDDAILQEWAKKGIPLHRDKRATCGFCGSPLPKDLWDKIDQHFSKESQNLEHEIVTLLGEVEGEERRVAALLNFDKSSLYSTLHNDFNQIFTEVSNAIDSYKTELKKVAGGLRIRQSNPFKTLHLGANGTSESEVEAAFAKLIPLLETQTKKTEGLASDQANARTELRLGSVSSFIKSINLSQIDADIATLTAEVKTLNFDAIEAKRLASGLEREIEELRKLLRDERRGAEKVNQFLTHYFGHDSLKLVAVDEVDPHSRQVKARIPDSTGD